MLSTFCFGCHGERWSSTKTYETAFNKLLFCENLSFSHTNVLFGFSLYQEFLQYQATTLRFCGQVELGVSKYQKTGHTRQGVNTEEKDRSAPLLPMYIYFSFATGRLAIRFSHVTSRNQLCEDCWICEMAAFWSGMHR